MTTDTLIFDGKHLLWRCADAFSQLSYKVGEREVGTGAVYGWITCATRVHRKYGGAAIVAWEGKNNFRYGLYPEYKAKKKLTDEEEWFINDMREQETRLKALLRAIGVSQFCAVGCEADDVIGTLAARHEVSGRNVVIYSGDSDLRQLVTPMVTVVSPGYKGAEKVYDASAVEDKHGVPPKYIADLKALAGDHSDNIPGAKGIGEVRAAQLIREFGDLDHILKAADSDVPMPIPDRLCKVLVDSAPELRLYKRLTTILMGADMRLIEPKRNPKLVNMTMMAYGFVSLLHPPEMEAVLALGKR